VNAEAIQFWGLVVAGLGLVATIIGLFLQGRQTKRPRFDDDPHLREIDRRERSRDTLRDVASGAAVAGTVEVLTHHPAPDPDSVEQGANAASGIGGFLKGVWSFLTH